MPCSTGPCIGPCTSTANHRAVHWLASLMNTDSGGEPVADNLGDHPQRRAKAARPGLGMPKSLFGVIVALVIASAVGVGLVSRWNLIAIGLTIVLCLSAVYAVIT